MSKLIYILAVLVERIETILGSDRFHDFNCWLYDVAYHQANSFYWLGACDADDQFEMYDISLFKAHCLKLWYKAQGYIVDVQRI